MTTPSAERAALPRFDRTERIVHWVNATLFGVLIGTGAILYLGQLAALVGRRPMIREIHVISGLALPVPLLLGVISRRGGALRRDLGRLNRWSPGDRRWLFTRGREAQLQIGKFNPGQKLNAAFIAGAGLVMMGSGAMLKWFAPFPNSWRTGATFVHDWTALALGLSIIGHIWLAIADPDALRGIVRGWVPASWAKARRPRWHDEMVGAEPPEAANPSAVSGSG